MRNIKNDWIRADKQQPDNYGEYLVFNDDKGYIAIGEYAPAGFSSEWGWGVLVTHWMPLPKGRRKDEEHEEE